MPAASRYEWLEGGRFLIQRSRNDHELFPDAIGVIGAPEDGDGLVHGVLRLARRAPDVRASRSTTACCACGATPRGSTSATPRSSARDGLRRPVAARPRRRATGRTTAVTSRHRSAPPWTTPVCALRSIDAPAQRARRPPARAPAAVPPASAGAANSDVKVTIAARSCDAYTDIFGNRARNDIMESLRDLGPDTPYSSNQAAGPGPPGEGGPVAAVQVQAAPGLEVHARQGLQVAGGHGAVGLAVDRDEPVLDRRSRRRPRRRC